MTKEEIENLKQFIFQMDENSRRAFLKELDKKSKAKVLDAIFNQMELLKNDTDKITISIGRGRK